MITLPIISGVVAFFIVLFVSRYIPRNDPAIVVVSAIFVWFTSWVVIQWVAGLFIG